MTALPSGPVTEQTGSLLDLLANDPRKEDDYDRFVAALRSCVHGGWVSMNDVRTALSNEYGLTIQPQRFSSLYRRACKDGLLRWYPRPEFYDVNADKRAGNAGRPQRRYLATRALIHGGAA